MKRNVSLEEISDGKLYTSNDMVKADCGDCAGCSACCHGMGESIVLDPLDIYRLTTNLKQYEEFVNDWHNFLLNMQERAADSDETSAKQISMFILQNFYMKPYDRSKEFYPQYEERRSGAKLIFHV